jgi:hypothetical protein
VYWYRRWGRASHKEISRRVRDTVYRLCHLELLSMPSLASYYGGEFGDSEGEKSVRTGYDCKRFSVKKLGNRKRPRSFLNVAFIYAGNYLLSHTLSRAVPSAQRGLTSVFGMGTGGTPAVRSPTTWSRQSSAVSRQQTLLWRLIPPMRGKLVKERIYEV